MSAMAVDVCRTCRGEPLLFTCPECKADQDAYVDPIAHGDKADADYALFVDACRTDAYSHGGFVSHNRVRAAMSNEHGLTVLPQRYSRFWGRAQKDGYLSTKFTEEPNRDKHGRNLGKKSRIYRWLPAGDTTP